MRSIHEKGARNEKSMSLKKEYMKFNTSFYPSAKKVKKDIPKDERIKFFHDL